MLKINLDGMKTFNLHSFVSQKKVGLFKLDVDIIIDFEGHTVDYMYVVKIPNRTLYRPPDTVFVSQRFLEAKDEYEKLISEDIDN